MAMGGSVPDASFIWLFYLPFCTWAVLGPSRTACTFRALRAVRVQTDGDNNASETG
ncbi:hypothetical protein V1951_15340 [Yersinia sp. 2544 StPb PI]|uniref:hypothetical protein n=1 Tax=unclassified Yersinia (in: enterobacteria) TaxID=2653513 RepID=UPI00355BA5CC